jgi:hypothetical protein
VQNQRQHCVYGVYMFFFLYLSIHACIFLCLMFSAEHRVSYLWNVRINYYRIDKRLSDVGTLRFFYILGSANLANVVPGPTVGADTTLRGLIYCVK